MSRESPFPLMVPEIFKNQHHDLHEILHYWLVLSDFAVSRYFTVLFQSVLAHISFFQHCLHCLDCACIFLAIFPGCLVKSHCLAPIWSLSSCGFVWQGIPQFKRISNMSPHSRCMFGAQSIFRHIRTPHIKWVPCMSMYHISYIPSLYPLVWKIPLCRVCSIGFGGW